MAFGPNPYRPEDAGLFVYTDDAGLRRAVAADLVAELAEPEAGRPGARVRLRDGTFQPAAETFDALLERLRRARGGARLD